MVIIDLANMSCSMSHEQAGNEWSLPNASDMTANSAAVAISNLAAFYTNHHDIRSCSPFFTYYLLSAAIIHISRRKNCPIIFNAAALEYCEVALEGMSKTWSSAARTLEIIRGIADRNNQTENPVGIQQDQPGNPLNLDLLPLEGWNGYYDLEDFTFEQMNGYI